MATAVLSRFLADHTVEGRAIMASEALKPRPGDYARVFTPDVADGLAAAYKRLWDEGKPAPHPKAHHDTLQLSIAQAADFVTWNEPAKRFPNGYRDLAAYMQPERIWFAWRFHQAGKSIGMAYDGLVWMDDHWAWFPKPWHALRLIEAPPPPTAPVDD